MKGYDKLSVNRQMLLDLRFREGTGITTQDIAKPHHEPVVLVNTPTWANLVSGLPVLQLSGVVPREYIEIDNADSLDMDFMSGDFSLGGWFNWSAGDDSQITIGRYELDVGGWELYLYDDPNHYLTLRHHHSGTIVDGHPRSACGSTGWTQGTWHFFGVSRSGVSQSHYRNGVALPTTCTTILVDPETCAQDLVIGVRFTKGDNSFKGQLDGFRVWDRSLSASEWLSIFEMEKHWYGVS